MNRLTASSNLGKERAPLDEATLVSQLNTLLISLNIPIPLISPTDLTPSLLIAVLESLLGMRIPYITHRDSSNGSKASKVQHMKVFLGVLETDILKTDVGLSEIDPRRLADGEWDEVLFIAELLCWIGRRMGFIKKTRAKSHSAQVSSPTLVANFTDLRTLPSGPPSLSPKSQLDLDAESVFQTASTATRSTSQSQVTGSPFVNRLVDDESMTSICTPDHQRSQTTTKSESDDDDDALSSVSDVLGALSPFKKLQQIEPTRHNENVSSSSLLFRQDTVLTQISNSPSPKRRRQGCPEHYSVSCTCDLTISPIQSPPIRYNGYIQPVDEDAEIASFELSRSISVSSNSCDRQERKAKVGHNLIFTKLKALLIVYQGRPLNAASAKEQYARTLELLNERARLLKELAEIKQSSLYLER